MTEIRKESWAAESLRNAKSQDSMFVPLDYNYGKNFDGPRGPEKQAPHIDSAPGKVKSNKSSFDIDIKLV
jgi:hypothetical protein